MASNGIVELSTENFEKEVIASDVPVIVDFWAPWCAPCRMIAPELEKLVDEVHGRAKIAKVNVDDHPGIAGDYGVSGIPTLIKFESGREAQRLTGARRKDEIKAAFSLS